MPGSIGILYSVTALTGSPQNAINSMVVPQDGNIVGLWYALTGDLKTDGAFIRAEVSMSPVNQFGTGPSWNVLHRINLMVGFVTSGLAPGCLNGSIVIPPFRVLQGEFIYLHQNGTNAITPALEYGLMFDFPMRGRTLT